MGNNAQWTNDGSELSVADVVLSLDYVAGSAPLLPVAPSIVLAGTITSSSVQFTLTGGANITTLTPQRRTVGGDAWTDLPQIEPEATGYSFLLLQAGGAYDFRMRAENDAGADYSNIVTASTTTASASVTDLTKILRYEDYATMSVGQSLQSLPANRGYFDAAGGSTYSTDRTYNGQRVVKTTVTQGDDESTGGSGGFNKFGWGYVLPTALQRGDRMFARVPMYFPSDFTITSSTNGAIKAWRYRMFSATSANKGANDLQIMNEPNLDWRFIFEGDSGPGWKDNLTGGAGKVVKGVWQVWETEIVFDTVPVSMGGSAMMRLRLNGEVVAEIFDRKTMDLTTDQCLELYLFTYWNPLIPKTQSMYMGPPAFAIQSSWRDDTPHMAVDGDGNPYIGMDEGSPYAAPLQFTPTFLINAEGATLNQIHEGSAADRWTDAAGATYAREPSVVSIPPFEGARLWECNIEQGAEGFGTWGGRKMLGSPGVARYGVVHAQWSVWYPTTFSFLAGPYLKFARIHIGTAYDGGNVGYLDVYIDNDGTLRLQNEVHEATTRLEGTSVGRGRWETFELRAVLDTVAKSAGGAAEWSLWQRQAGGMVRIGHIDNQRTLGATSQIADAFLLWTYWNSPPGGEGMYPVQTQQAFADRIVICKAASVAAMDALLVETDASGRKIIGGVV